MRATETSALSLRVCGGGAGAQEVDELEAAAVGLVEERIWKSRWAEGVGGKKEKRPPSEPNAWR